MIGLTVYHTKFTATITTIASATTTVLHPIDSFTIQITNTAKTMCTSFKFILET